MTRRMIKTHAPRPIKFRMVPPARWQRVILNMIQGDVMQLLLNDRKDITKALSNIGFTYLSDGVCDGVVYVLGLLNGQYKLFFQFEGAVIHYDLTEGNHYHITDNGTNKVVGFTFKIKEMTENARATYEQSIQPANDEREPGTEGGNVGDIRGVGEPGNG